MLSSDIILIALRNGALVAVRCQNGDILWRKQETYTITDIAAHHDLLFVGSIRDPNDPDGSVGSVTAFQARDGQLVQQWASDEPTLMMTVAYAGKFLLIGTTFARINEDSTETMYTGTVKDVSAWDMEAGTVQWSFRPRSGSFGIILEARGQCMYVLDGGSEGALSIHDIETGKHLWKSDGYINLAPPVVSEDGSLALARLREPDRLDLVEATTGHLVATMPLQLADRELAVGDRNDAYVLRQGPEHTGYLVALEVPSGRELWRTPILERYPMLYPKQLVLTDDTLYYAQVRRPGRESEIEVGAINRGTGDCLWRQIAPYPNHQSIGDINLVGNADGIYVVTPEGLLGYAPDGGLRWQTPLNAVSVVRVPLLVSV